MASGNPYVIALITQAGVICTALFALIGVIIQVRSGNKAKKSDELVKSIDSKLDKMKEDSEVADKKINQKIDDQQFRYYKNQLIMMMSRIQNGYVPTQEEKYVLHEQKAKYNDMGRR